MPTELSSPRVAHEPDDAARHRRALASWGGALGLHVALVGALVLLALVTRPAPPPEPPEVMIVEIITPDAVPRSDEPEPPAAEEAGSASDAPADLASNAETGAPGRFEVELPPRDWPDVLRLEDRSQGRDAIAPGVPSNVRRALVAAFYCRPGALGMAAERARCPPLLDQFALAARAEAIDPFAFFDPAVVSAARAREASPHGPAVPLETGRDQRLGAASEMRDSLPPAHPTPFFGD